MVIKPRAAAPATLLEAACLALLWALLYRPAAGQDAIENTFEVPITDSSPSSPLKVHGKVLLHELVKGPSLRFAWDHRVEVKNISDKSIILLIASLKELGRYPESSGPPHYRRDLGGLGGGGTNVRGEDRFFSDTDIRPSDSVVLLDTAERGELAEQCCVNSLDKVRAPEAQFKVLFVQFADGSIYGDPAAATEAFVWRKGALAALGRLAELESNGEKSFGEQLDRLCPPLGSICAQIAQALEKNGERAAMAEVNRLISIANKRAQLLPDVPGN